MKYLARIVLIFLLFLFPAINYIITPWYNPFSIEPGAIIAICFLFLIIIFLYNLLNFIIKPVKIKLCVILMNLMIPLGFFYLSPLADGFTKMMFNKYYNKYNVAAELIISTNTYQTFEDNNNLYRWAKRVNENEVRFALKGRYSISYLINNGKPETSKYGKYTKMKRDWYIVQY